MEHRITLTLAGLGATAEHADRLLEVLVELAGEAGPVVASNERENTLHITLALESNDAVAAVTAAGSIARRAIERVPFPSTTGRIVDVEVERIDQAAAVGA